MGQAEQAAVESAYAAVAGRIRANLLTVLAGLWSGLSSFRDEDAAGFVARVVPLVEATQVQVASLTAAYLAAVLGDMTGTPAVPAAVSRQAVTGLRGVPAVDVYRRPFVEAWTALSQDVPFDEAVARGGTRLASLAATDVQLAKTHTSRRVLEADGRVVGYRRVLHGSRSCGLCVVASTQRYHKKELMPVHPSCDCGVQPIVGREDPGQVLDPDLLESAHTAIEQRFGQSDPGARAPDYRKLLITREHGEIGPVLTLAEHRFTGPRDI